MSPFSTALGVYALAAKRSAPEKLAKTQDLRKHSIIGPLVGMYLTALAGGVSPGNGTLLVPFIGKRKDQGRCSGCTSFSFCGALETRCAYAKQEPSFPLSEREVYACTREWARGQATPAGFALTALTDDGAELGDVLASVAVFGVTKFAGPSPDGRNSDIWTASDVASLSPVPAANVNDEADGEQLESAASDPLSGAYTIDVTSADAVAKALAALSAGYPLYVATFVDSAFMSLTFGQIAQAPNQQDPSGGGHALYIAGFRESSAVPGTYEWLVCNSWGSWAGALSAGDGMVWASQSWLLACWEIWCVDETLVPARKAVA